jgi:hypothetical protein
MSAPANHADAAAAAGPYGRFTKGGEQLRGGDFHAEWHYIDDLPDPWLRQNRASDPMRTIKMLLRLERKVEQLAAMVRHDDTAG